jgi:hypothetical protein
LDLERAVAVEQQPWRLAAVEACFSSAHRKRQRELAAATLSPLRSCFSTCSFDFIDPSHFHMPNDSMLYFSCKEIGKSISMHYH